MSEFLDKTGKELMITSIISLIVQIAVFLFLAIRYDWMVILGLFLFGYASTSIKEHAIFIEIANYKRKEVTK
jgi:phage-related holin